MQTIERTTLSELVGNEQYARKVLPFIRGEYFGDRTERIVFLYELLYLFKYNTLSAITEILFLDEGKHLSCILLITYQLR